MVASSSRYLPIFNTKIIKNNILWFIILLEHGLTKKRSYLKLHAPLMFKKVHKILNSFKRLTSTIFVDMVRYFPNPYNDYSPQVTAELQATNKNYVCPLIAEHIENILNRLPATRKNVDGGLYVGISGISYMFYHLSKNPQLAENKALYLQKGIEYIQPSLSTSAGDKTSFLLGDAGSWAVATVLFKEVADDGFKSMLSAYKALYNNYLNPRFLKCGGDEFFVGRAGYIAGALWLARELKAPVLTPEELYKICDLMVASGKDYAKSHGSPCPLMYHYYNTQYLGAAHGISTILQVLLSVPGYLTYNKSAAKDIKDTIYFVASLQSKDGNWPCCLEEVNSEDHKLIHWCHGAPGTIYLMAKSYLVYHDEKFLKACQSAGEVVWQKGLLRKGPGICHGVAGNGYVFMLLYRLTHDEKYLYRAKKFIDFMSAEQFTKEARLPDNPETLFEGTAGTVCFLADILTPELAEFPFMDVFLEAPIN